MPQPAELRTPTAKVINDLPEPSGATRRTSRAHQNRQYNPHVCYSGQKLTPFAIRVGKPNGLQVEKYDLNRSINNRVVEMSLRNGKQTTCAPARAPYLN